jgi:hypothetical protein
LTAHLTISTIGLLSAFYFNERLYHIDYIFKVIDPNLTVNTRELTHNNKENVKFKILQALVLEEIERDQKMK